MPSRNSIRPPLPRKYWKIGLPLPSGLKSAFLTAPAGIAWCPVWVSAMHNQKHRIPEWFPFKINFASIYLLADIPRRSVATTEPVSSSSPERKGEI